MVSGGYIWSVHRIITHLKYIHLNHTIMIEYYKMALNRYADFSGRSRRSEYWYFVLGNVLIVFALAIVGGGIAAAVGSEEAMMIPAGLIGIFYLAVLIPSLALIVRRFHDQGKSGWFALLMLIPYLGGLIVFVFMCLDSEPGANKWGPNPKTGAVANATSHLVD